MRRKIIDGIGWIVFLSFASSITYLRFKNPQMTETELLINFWWVWLALVATCCVYYFLVSMAAPNNKMKADDGDSAGQ
jgi:hypothetical protein